MQFLISKNGTQIGPLTEEEVRAKLASGEVATTDLAWREGLAEWQPLGILLGGGVLRGVPRSAAVDDADEGTSGLAIGSLICGLLVAPALIAVILGHIALSQIHRSGGALRGRGMAIAGLVLGYIELVFIGLAILAAIAFPVFNTIQQKAYLVKTSNEARQIVVAMKMYATEHNGSYPEKLEDLTHVEGFDAKALECTLSKNYPGVRWVYQGGGAKDSDPPKTVLLKTSTTPKLKKHIAAYNDGSVEVLNNESGAVRPAAATP